MPRDKTDTLFLKGLLAFAVLAGVVYYYPFAWPEVGYKGQVELVQKSSEEFEPILEEYNKHYPPAPRSVIGKPDDTEPVAPARLEDIEGRKREYGRGIRDLRERIKVKEAGSRVQFASWAEAPEQERVPGVYYMRTWDSLKNRLVDEARRANVDFLDQDMGFRDPRLDLRSVSRDQARERLRELFIAETVIKLCMKAKLDQEAIEKQSGHKPEAFMRIIAVAPEDPVKVGPYSRLPNPKYDKDERNPKAEGFNKFIIHKWPEFIVMYPIEIRLQCDVNSLRNFLSSVRTEEGHFLVIRNLQIVSSFLNESKADRSEFEKVAGEVKPEDYKEEHIWVRLSAAGMDFFEVAANKAEAATAVLPKETKAPPKGQLMGH